ncbi:predicted protein [Plenodomus lingam JN3]|uniref:Predicted protein n=1 Tax=Leptosphaeria maculans (strain JN3 / isolate v23.1.3 / race Av1-4-5-6-7-8) TaxID=985895 RepID=E5ADU2_LEPMJ|nr:predicted protein [Plenodomus lingam JN3]CBY01381.1 predicted protein [Plenodomus lingam JN3]
MQYKNKTEGTSSCRIDPQNRPFQKKVARYILLGRPETGSESWSVASFQAKHLQV